MEIAGTILQKNFREHSYNPKYVGWICVLFFALILGRALNDLFFYAFVGVSLLVFAMSSTGHCISLLLFLLPFSTILKYTTGGISFFTVLFFLVILKMVISHRKIDIKLLFCLIICLIYNVLLSGIGQLTTIITMLSGILMLYYLRDEDIDVNSAIVIFSMGICLSSIIALFKSSLPIVNTFVTDTMLKLGENSYTTRFSGLHGNPNYYTLDIIVALSAIIVLMYNNRAQKIHTICLIALSIFGLMSVSKSFLLTWLLLILCWFFLSAEQGAGKLVKFVFIAVIGVMLAYYFAYDSINAYLLRFINDGSGTLESITTGRSDIWLVYLKETFSDLKIVFFGSGLKTIIASLGRGTHNTYLEFLFNLGIIGTTILVATLRIGMGKIELKGMIWLPVVMLLVRMFAIHILTYDNLWFYLAILIMLTHDYKKSHIIKPHTIEGQS